MSAKTGKDAKKKTWERKKRWPPCLWRHRNGGYYAKVRVQSKDSWESLHTTSIEIAKAQLPEVKRRLRGANRRDKAPTVRQALAAALREYERDPDRPATTIRYYREQMRAIIDTFPAPDLRLDKVKASHMRDWHVAHSARYCATRTNGCLPLWRRAFKDAIQAGHVSEDLTRDLKRRRAKSRDLRVPTPVEFLNIVNLIADKGKQFSRASAFAVEFIAYTGMRKTEARSIRWKDVGDKEITVRTRKNNELRRVPIIGACANLLVRMKAICNHRPDDPVILVTPKDALANACKALELDHLCIHDLRHIFATRCLQSGAPLPTVAYWLGHKDGGVLAARVYGHLCNEHSLAAAAKVKF